VFKLDDYCIPEYPFGSLVSTATATTAKNTTRTPAIGRSVIVVKTGLDPTDPKH
jgi:hypothetical protein